ncbi:hypothetical protein OS493_016108 [Desmophyllum pertusum]|uniref:SLC12A transporter C-terminal domain-containing protein n=1 Tax=Desmophyllum pertusum TaxID=174260 RepID=A0A9X0A2V6_9CNID|nr:hypothetical protein OS493_016108 [Desmophyllum pertusum]
MANLLKRFRIDFTSVVEVEGINVQPSSSSIHNFMKLPVRDEFFDIRTLEKDRKTMRNIRLGELIRQHSNDAKLIVLTLPVPKVEMMSPLLYMSWLDVLSAASPPVLMVRGNQQSVLTFYSTLPYKCPRRACSDFQDALPVFPAVPVTMTPAVENPPAEEEANAEVISGTESDSDDELPDLEEGDAGQPNISSDVAAAAGLSEEPVSKAKQSRGEKRPGKQCQNLD